MIRYHLGLPAFRDFSNFHLLPLIELHLRSMVVVGTVFPTALRRRRNSTTRISTKFSTPPRISALISTNFFPLPSQLLATSFLWSQLILWFSICHIWPPGFRFQEVVVNLWIFCQNLIIRPILLSDKKKYISTILLGSEQSLYFQVYLARIILGVSVEEYFQKCSESGDFITMEIIGDFTMFLQRKWILSEQASSTAFLLVFYYCNTKVLPNSDQ